MAKFIAAMIAASLLVASAALLFFATVSPEGHYHASHGLFALSMLLAIYASRPEPDYKPSAKNEPTHDRR